MVCCRRALPERAPAKEVMRMKRIRDFSFRTKLLLVNLSAVLVVVVGITFMLTLTASERATESHDASLNLLTEQALINFASKADSIRQHLYTMSATTNAPQQMGALRALDPASNAYLQAKHELILALSRMIDSSAPYDQVSVKLDGGECVSSDTYDDDIRLFAEELLRDETYAENAYGSNTWVRTETGELYLIRDVYATQPLRHVGRIAAHIRQAPLVSLGQSNETMHCSLAFYDENGTLITSAGDAVEGITQAAAAMLGQDNFTGWTEDGQYAACIHRRDGWQAVGLLPVGIVNEVQTSVTRSSILIAVLGGLFGLLVTITFSHSMTRQISRLVRSMNQVAAGDLDVVLPVEGQDDIGVLTKHFNDMTQKTRELLARVVQEETNKRQAEFQNLEYEYRFLQWQINPHFIYNALETVNGLAKLDGNDELCEIIVLLSAYFRQNAETMKKRFVPIKREFRSLKQYVTIYQHIYGDAFEASFVIGEDTTDALVPTMMIQPLLENALIHGVSGVRLNHIRVSSETEGEKLLIRIRDDGAGMTADTLRRLLSPPAEDAQTRDERTSLGVRNVLERMRLIYGDEASIRITSEPQEGTCVEMRLPLCYTERLSPFYQNASD